MIRHTPSSSPRAPWHIPWVRSVLVLCLVLFVSALLVETFSRLERYANSLIQGPDKRPLKRLIMTDAPPWLSGAILRELASQAVDFALYNKDHPEYAAELRDPLNGDILSRIAAIYTADPTYGEDAWIKKINFVRRVWLPDQQVIEISAEYRQPAGLVELSGMYYLIDTEGVRLPGAYPPKILPALHWLIQIKGASGPVPPPGSAFDSHSINVALQMINLLSAQPYAWQIQAVDVSNLDGKVNPDAPEITLLTTFGGQVWWGVAPGKEGFYEVPATRKLDSLLKIYQQYRRIDAGEPYVDIRGDQVLVPRPKSELAPVTPNSPDAPE
jgi:hypothetical protein